MNLHRLQWTKNVRRSDEWAYSEFEVSKQFKLAWKNNEANANRLDRDDLILLRQRGYVTHLVKVLNHQAEREDWQGDYNIYRIVEVLWAINFSHPPIAAKADEVFGYSAVLKLQGGKAMKLEELSTFKEAWESRGGITAFQDYVQSRLLAISNPI